jgi:diaminopimelate decarboxylase
MSANQPKPVTENRDFLEEVARKVGTPFWLYDAAELRRRIADIRRICDEAGVQPRYAMKACPATRILKEMLAADIWIDAVSGNEVLRAIRAGYKGGSNPPAIMFTADVFRDNGLQVVMDNGIMPNIGSPGQIADLQAAGFHGQIAIRVNPGFGHGHVNACDTGGPSSKHGIWFEDAAAVADMAAAAGLEIVVLHAHIGSGPQMEELLANLRRLAGEFAALAPRFPALQAVSLGGGIPHSYREAGPGTDVAPLAGVFREARAMLQKAVGRDIRVEIEPGRYYVASCASVVARVADVKQTRANEKGRGHIFAMVDAGFVDLIRPAMYGSYHRISVPGRGDVTKAPVVVAGPLCESGDVFTRDSSDLLAPRELPVPEKGDLVVLHDAGAYGYAMSSNYNSVGRSPQVWLEDDGGVRLISRRETVDDILGLECYKAI